MWGTVLGWFRGILDAVNMLFDWVFKAFLLYMARRSGKKEREHEYQEDMLKIKTKQLEIANRAKYRVNELLARARLRKRK